MRDVEARISGMGARADRALALTERTPEARERATEAITEAGLNGRAWWAAKSVERWPERACRLMVAEGAWESATAALDAAGVEWREA